jgi:hypothetical protein
MDRELFQPPQGLSRYRHPIATRYENTATASGRSEKNVSRQRRQQRYQDHNPVVSPSRLRLQ